MKTIEEQEELLKIEGGFFSWGIAGTIAAAIIFIIGVFDGYTRPMECRR